MVQKVVQFTQSYKSTECDRTGQVTSGWDGTEQDKAVEDGEEETTRQKKTGGDRIRWDTTGRTRTGVGKGRDAEQDIRRGSTASLGTQNDRFPAVMTRRYNREVNDDQTVRRIQKIASLSLILWLYIFYLHFH